MTGLAPKVTLTPTDDGAMLLDERTGLMFHLNTSAYEIVSRAVVGASVGEAADMLHTRYGLDPGCARRDVETLLGDLAERGLIIGEGR